MIIGIDFDNTIINYEKVWCTVAKRHNILSKNSNLTSKTTIRNFLWKQPNGDLEWQKLQAEVYGKSLNSATLFPGVVEFFKHCVTQGIPIHIISHKTPISNCPNRPYPLQQPAKKWLSEHLIPRVLDFNFEENVHFCSTQELKVNKIHNIGCTHFIDDLEEIFTHPKFPGTTDKYLFSKKAPSKALDALQIKNWGQAIKIIFG